MNSNKSKISYKWGFTLIELLVVVLIIGILAAVAVPQYQKAVLKSKYSTLMAGAKAIADAEEVYFLENGEYTRNIDKLNVSINSPVCAYDIVETQTTSCISGAYFLVQDETSYSRVLSAFVIGNKAPLYYMIYFQHSSERPGKQICMVNSYYTSDTKFSQICKSFGGVVDSESTRTYHLN